MDMKLSGYPRPAARSTRKKRKTGPIMGERKRPPMFIRSTIMVIALGASVGVASAELPNFCTDDGKCVEVFVQNKAAATVTSVKIKQQSGPNDCVSGEENTISGNLAGGTPGFPGEGVWFNVDPMCKYKIVFKTTSGCTGDKTTHFYPDD